MPARPSKTIVAENVRRLRQEFGLTQVELARRAGLPQPRIAEMEAAKYGSLDSIDVIADALGVAPAALYVDHSSVTQKV